MKIKRIFQILFTVLVVGIFSKTTLCYAMEWFPGSKNDTSFKCEVGAEFNVFLSTNEYNHLSFGSSTDASVLEVRTGSNENALFGRTSVACGNSLTNCIYMHVSCKKVGTAKVTLHGVGTSTSETESEDRTITFSVIEPFPTNTTYFSGSDENGNLTCHAGNKITTVLTFKQVEGMSNAWGAPFPYSKADSFSSSDASVATIKLIDEATNTVEIDCLKEGSSQIKVDHLNYRITTSYYTAAGRFYDGEYLIDFPASGHTDSLVVTLNVLEAVEVPDTAMNASLSFALVGFSSLAIGMFIVYYSVKKKTVKQEM